MLVTLSKALHDLRTTWNCLLGIKSSVMPDKMIKSPEEEVETVRDPLMAAFKGSVELPKFKEFEIADWAAETTSLLNLKEAI